MLRLRGRNPVRAVGVWAAACVAVGGGLLTPEATSATVVLRGSFIVDGADQRVALADRAVTLPDGGTSEPNFPVRLHVFLALSSGDRGVLRQFDGQLAGSAHVRQHGGCDDQFQATVAASEQWVALTTARSQDCPEGAGDFIIPGAVVVSASSYHGSATVVERCSAASQAFGEGEGLKGSITGQLDGSLLAYESCDQRSIVVRDLSKPSPPAVVSIGQQVRDFTIAGDYVAVEAAPLASGPPTQVGVYRWRDGTLAGRFGGVVIDRFAVDRNGTLAMIYGGPSVGCTPGYSLAVLGIGQPSARVLSVAPCADVLSILDGQILFERLLAPGTARVVSTEDIAVTDANGSQTRGVLPPQMAEHYPELVDLAPSGELRRQVAACGDSDEYQFDPAQPLAPPPELPPCHAYFTRSEARLSNGVLSVRLRCPYGCEGAISLRVARTGRLLRFTQTPANAIYFFAPPGVRNEEAMLSQTSRRLLRPGARLIASLVAYTAGAAQDPTATHTVASRESQVLTVRGSPRARRS